MTIEADLTSAETLDSALARAAEALARGDQETAVRILQTEIPERFAGDEQAFARSGDLLNQLKCFDEAEDVLQRGLQSVPHGRWIAYSYASVARTRGDLPLALERFTATRDRFPDFGTVNSDIVGLLIALGRLEEAEAVASEARDAFPGAFWVAEAHAGVAEARGEHATALARRHAARLTWPDDIFLVAGEMRALIRLGRFAEAGYLLASAHNPPAGPELWREAAQLAEQAGAWASAASWWEQFRTARPDEVAGYANGARALLRSGNAEDARRVFAFARDRWPDAVELAAVQAELQAAAPAEPAAAEPAPSATPAEPAPAADVQVAGAEKKLPPARPAKVFGWLGW